MDAISSKMAFLIILLAFATCKSLSLSLSQYLIVYMIVANEILMAGLSLPRMSNAAGHCSRDVDCTFVIKCHPKCFPLCVNGACQCSCAATQKQVMVEGNHDNPATISKYYSFNNNAN